MEAAQALADLTEISTQIESAVLFDESGEIEGSTLPEGGKALAAAAARLLEQAATFGPSEVSQLEVAVQDGSLFVVREGDRRIAATTGPAPTVGLVFYDLKSCLRAASEDAKPKRRRTKKAADET